MSQEGSDNSSLRVSPPIDSVTCPDCGHAVGYYDEVNSTHFVCPKCLVLFQVEDGKPTQAIVRLREEYSISLALPVGAKAALRGRIWQVLGVLRWQDTVHHSVRWTEYVIRDTENGQTGQLVVYRGHWTLVQDAPTGLVAAQLPSVRAVSTSDGNVFNLYNKYSQDLLWATGEFDWNPNNDGKKLIWEFISPPRMLVGELEKANGKIAIWYLAEHIEPNEIARAFGINRHLLGERIGSGAIQPAPGGESTKGLLKVAIALAGLAILIFLTLKALQPSQTLLDQSFVTMGDRTREITGDASQLIVTPSFVVKEQAALSVELKADLDNSWLEVGATLINEETDQTFEFVQASEYYHGEDSDGKWTEGNLEVQATLGSIPPGHYHFILSPFSDQGKSTVFSMIVYDHTPLTSNLLLAVLMILAWPVTQAIRRSLHESQRWLNSDYGP